MENTKRKLLRMRYPTAQKEVVANRKGKPNGLPVVQRYPGSPRTRMTDSATVSGCAEDGMEEVTLVVLRKPSSIVLDTN